MATAVQGAPGWPFPIAITAAAPAGSRPAPARAVGDEDASPPQDAGQGGQPRGRRSAASTAAGGERRRRPSLHRKYKSQLVELRGHEGGRGHERPRARPRRADAHRVEPHRAGERRTAGHAARAPRTRMRVPGAASAGRAHRGGAAPALGIRSRPRTTRRRWRPARHRRRRGGRDREKDRPRRVRGRVPGVVRAGAPRDGPTKAAGSRATSDSATVRGTTWPRGTARSMRVRVAPAGSRPSSARWKRGRGGGRGPDGGRERDRRGCGRGPRRAPPGPARPRPRAGSGRKMPPSRRSQRHSSGGYGAGPRSSGETSAKDGRQREHGERAREPPLRADPPRAQARRVARRLFDTVRARRQKNSLLRVPAVKAPPCLPPGWRSSSPSA